MYTDMKNSVRGKPTRWLPWQKKALRGAAWFTIAALLWGLTLFLALEVSLR